MTDYPDEGRVYKRALRSGKARWGFVIDTYRTVTKPVPPGRLTPSVGAEREQHHDR